MNKYVPTIGMGAAGVSMIVRFPHDMPSLIGGTIIALMAALAAFVLYKTTGGRSG